MLANIDEIITDCRSLLDEPVTNENKFYSDTEITRWANEGSDLFTTLTRVLCKYYNKTITSGMICNDREIRLNSDFIAFDAGGLLYDDHPLEEVSLVTLDEWAGTSWRDSTGTPRVYYRRSDYIGFYPKPEVGSVLKYYGIERAPTMVVADGVAPLSGDYRIVAFRRYIRDYAMAFCYWKKGDKDSYNQKMGEFREGVVLMNSVVHGSNTQNWKMIPQNRRGARHSLNALEL